MPMRLRFALHGTRHHRIFHLVAVEQGKRRDAKPAELLGIYNRYANDGELKKTIEWSVDRIRYWLSVGAIPSKSVVKLLELGNILQPGHPYRSQSDTTQPSPDPALVEPSKEKSQRAAVP